MKNKKIILLSGILFALVFSLMYISAGWIEGFNSATGEIRNNGNVSSGYEGEISCADNANTCHFYLDGGYMGISRKVNPGIVNNIRTYSSLSVTYNYTIHYALSSEGYAPWRNTSTPCKKCTFFPGDYDGDNVSDVVGYSNREKRGYYALSSLDFAWNTFIMPSCSAESSNCKLIPVTGDFNDDKKADFVAYDSVSGNIYYLLSPLYSPWGKVVLASCPKCKVIPRDYEGDGKSDIVLYNPDSGILNYFLSSLNFAWRSVNFICPDCVFFPGDYDADGKSDFMAYDKSLGNLSIAFGPDFDVIDDVILAPSCPGCDDILPISGDFDGDKKADLVAYIPLSSDIYYLLNSEFRTAGGNWKNINTPCQNCTVINGDYDGDNLSDVVLYSAVAILQDDKTLPSIGFVEPTEEPGTINRPNIIVNVTAFDINLKSIKISLYNSTGLKISSTNMVDVAGTSTSLCYQETADQETDGDGSCGLNYTGAYGFDDKYFYVTYTKPADVLSSSKWRVKHSNFGAYDEDIPIDCWDAFPAKLKFRMYSSIESNNITSYGECNNGTDWKIITKQNSDYIGTYNSVPASTTNMYDGDWNTHAFKTTFGTDWDNCDSGCELARIFEEAMIFVISYPVSPFYQKFTNLADGTYQFRATACDFARNCNSTEPITVTISKEDITPPIISFVTPPTETSGSTIARTNIIVNVSASDNNFVKSINLRLYNSSALINTESTLTSTTSISSCYQESANVPNQAGTDGNCGLAYTGAYVLDNNYLYINYTRSGIALNSSKWKVKYSDLSIREYPIPIDCWKAFSGKLVFRIFSGIKSGNMTSYGECNNGTDWKIITDISSSQSGSVSSTYADTTNMYDGNWNTHAFWSSFEASFGAWQRCNSGCEKARIFEEAMVYLYTTSSASYTYRSFTNLANGTYYFNATACDNSNNCYDSETRQVTINTSLNQITDNLSPTISFISPTKISGSVINKTSIIANVTAADINLNSVTINLFNSTSRQTASRTTTATVITGVCYQETANQSTIGDGENCGLNYTGAYGFSNNYFYVNYTKPADVLSSSKWRVKHSNFGAYDEDIPIDCWNASLTKLVFRMYSSVDSNNMTSYGQCKNSTGWKTITQHTSAYTSGSDYSNTGTTNMYDGNWATQSFQPVGDYWGRCDSGCELAQIFEEAMIYSYITSSSAPFYKEFTNLANGTYYLNATACDTTGRCNSTETRMVTINTSSAEGNIYLQFSWPTDFAGISRTNILVNVSASDINLNNITINFYNSTRSLVSTNTSTTSPFFMNFTNLSEGTYYFNATKCTTANECSSTETNRVIIDLNDPVIAFNNNTESDNSTYARTNIVVNVSASDTLAISSITINLYNSSIINSTYLINKTTTSTSNNLFINFVNLKNRTYYFNAIAFDSVGKNSTTETRKVTINASYIDNVPPAIQFISPTEDNSILKRTNILVTVNAVDLSSGLKNITINLYNSARVLIDHDTSETSPNSAEFTGLDNSVYYFNATACDIAKNCKSTLTRKVVINTSFVDTTPPTITLLSPADNYNTSSRSINFVYNVSDASNIQNCRLIYNANHSNISSVTKGILQTFEKTLPSSGIYTWKIFCTDEQGNEGISSERTLNISICDNNDFCNTYEDCSFCPRDCGACDLGNGGGRVYLLSESEFKQGFTMNLYPGDIIKFRIGGELRNLILVRITGNSALIRLTPLMRDTTFSSGDEKKFNFADPDYYELYTKVNGISGNTVSVTVQGIYEPVLGCTPTCAGKTCGNNGCGGVCGTCGQGGVCSEGVCCSSQWNCDSGACSNGFIEQTCTDSNNCGTNIGKPEPETCSSNNIYILIGLAGFVLLVIVVGSIILLIKLSPRKKENPFKQSPQFQKPSQTHIENLKNFVILARKKGYKDEQIKKMLREKGWKEWDIDRAFFDLRKI